MKHPPWITALLDRPYTPERSLLADRWLAWVDGEAKAQVQEVKTAIIPRRRSLGRLKPERPLYATYRQPAGCNITAFILRGDGDFPIPPSLHRQPQVVCS
jgi:hypothetical protein